MILWVAALGKIVYFAFKTMLVNAGIKDSHIATKQYFLGDGYMLYIWDELFINAY